MSEIAAIFDMDGVLIDSVGLNWQAYNQLLRRQYGLEVADEDIRKYVGMSLHDQIALIEHDFSISINPPDFESESTKIKQKLFQTVQPKEGVAGLLKELKQAKIPTALATSSPHHIAYERLTKTSLWHYFDAHITEESVSRHKPHPDVYIEAAGRLAILPTKCVVFEDAPNGIEAAKRAGMQCVAIATPYVPMEYLNKADMLINSLNELTVEDLTNLVR